MWNLLIQNKEFLGIAIAFLGVIIPLMTFLIGKNKEQQQTNFEKFHKDLINGLSNQEKSIGLDQQVAIIFELRNFSKYYPVIKRILVDLREDWETQKEQYPKLVRLIKETDETISYINKIFIVRFFIRIKAKFF